LTRIPVPLAGWRFICHETIRLPLLIKLARQIPRIPTVRDHRAESADEEDDFWCCYLMSNTGPPSWLSSVGEAAESA